VEEQFYCIWPLVVFLVRDRKRLMQLALGLSVCALMLRVGLAMYSTALASGIVHEWTLCRMDTLMLGGVLALWLRGEGYSIRSAERCRVPLVIFFWAVVLLISVYAAIHPRVGFGYGFFGATYGGTLLALAFAVLIYLSLQPGTFWNRIFSVAWLRSFGKYSYGMYVLHILVGYLVSTTLRRLLGTSLRIWLTPRLHSRPAAILVEFAVSVSVVYMAAWLSYNLYEVRFLRLKRRFA
jgi:peptidoglycan/LPS O-acetylase OafA/YrhL